MRTPCTPAPCDRIGLSHAPLCESLVRMSLPNFCVERHECLNIPDTFSDREAPERLHAQAREESEALLLKGAQDLVSDYEIALPARKRAAAEPQERSPPRLDGESSARQPQHRRWHTPPEIRRRPAPGRESLKRSLGLAGRSTCGRRFGRIKDHNSFRAGVLDMGRLTHACWLGSAPLRHLAIPAYEPTLRARRFPASCSGQRTMRQAR